MPDMIEKVTKGLECHKNGLCQIDDKTSCPYWECEKDCSKHLMTDALELLKEQKRLVNVDKLREKLGFAESCEKCKNDSWRCQRDTYFSEMDFCSRLDSAIEELIQEGQ